MPKDGNTIDITEFGKYVIISVKCENVGKLPWPTGTICKASYYQQSEIQPSILEREVWPQSQYNFEMALAKPDKPGNYLIDFSLFDDKGNQFGETGSLSLNFVSSQMDKDPERLYKYYDKLIILRSMGYTNDFEIKRALNRASGNIDRAIADLSSQPF